MAIERIVTERRSSLIARWLDAGLAGWPDRLGRCARGTSDPFSNPVRAIIYEALADVLDQVCQSSPPCPSPPLDRLMRLRALDTQNVSDAVAFLGALKPLVREEIGSQEQGPAEISRIEARIDAVTKLASDRFLAGRQLMVELRRRELGRRTAKLVERLERKGGELETEPWQP